ncbi:AI-2E family transporter [Bacteroidota bacterium]
MDNTVKNILLIFLLVLIFYLMSVLSSLLIPLVLAFLCASLFQPLVRKLHKVKAPDWLIMPIIIIITLGIFYGLLNIIIQTGTQISAQQNYLLQRLEIKVDGLFEWINSVFALHLTVGNIFSELSENISSQWISSTAGGIASSIGSFTGSFLMFALYYIVLLAGMANFDEYISYVGGDNKTSLMENAHKIQDSIFKYMLIKAIISISTGFFVYFICLLFGIKFAVLWAFLTIILNFIPSIGSVISTIPPVLMAIIQFDGIQSAFILLLCLIIVQFLIGNIIEPKIMGGRLKLNTLTVIFGLVFWGYLWGIPGMILSVPMMVLLKLLFEHSPSLNIVARIMGSPEKKRKLE